MWRLPRLLLVFKSLLLIGCQSPPDNPMAAEEEQMATEGDLSKYHYLVQEPYSAGLSHEGFLIGIEKSPVKSIGKTRALHDKRFRNWDAVEHPPAGQYLSDRNDHLSRTTNDPKSMFVSHILAYGLDPKTTARFDVSPLYTAYKANGFASETSQPSCAANGGSQASNKKNRPPPSSESKPSFYEDGWLALDQLYDVIKAKLAQSKPPHTHILVASMGWNNDQVESVRRYNALLGNIIAQARLDEAEKASTPEHEKIFNPLVIGLTWPSVWGGDSFFSSLNLLNHLISYPNKADDADEIGYTIANYLVNDIIHRLKMESAPKIKIVLIGHSMGARILSRAMFGTPLLNVGPNGKSPGDAADLFIGLQGAFSVRRFKKGHKLSLPASLFFTGEGSPYLQHEELPGRMVLTWSNRDTANPMAQWITGAAHVGGKAGYEEARKMDEEARKIDRVFDQLIWEKNGKDEYEFRRPHQSTTVSATCNELRESKKVMMVNANEIVHEHNDILDPEMGKLIWESIDCFARNP